MMSYTIAQKKYQSIKSRSFKTFIDLFLICTFINDTNLNSATEVNFMAFNYDDSRISKALKAYQLAKDSDTFCGGSIAELDKAIESWHKTNDLAPYKVLFNTNKMISEANFKTFYGEDNFDRECWFCKIKESEITKLISNGLIETKRLSTRGEKMEVDRLIPNKGYEEGNMATCCYWCNNAKTDEFSAEEFKPIGLLIGQALKKRILQAS